MFKHVRALVAHVRRSHKQLKLTRQVQTFSETRFNDVYCMLKVFSMVFDKDFLRDICEFLVLFDEVFQE